MFHDHGQGVARLVERGIGDEQGVRADVHGDEQVAGGTAVAAGGALAIGKGHTHTIGVYALV